MNKHIIYLDLFSGLGAFAKGLLNAGFVFKKHYYSDIDLFAVANYRYNFKTCTYVGDIKKIAVQKIQQPDLITFGSPCQNLSISGNREGLKGDRSSLFFEAIRILDRLRPKVFVFENVQGLLTSNKGKDFEVVLRTIADLGIYECQWQLVNTAWLLPQNRERLYLVGHLREQSRCPVFPLTFPYENNHPRENKVKVVGKLYEKSTQSGRIFDPSRFSPTLMATDGHGAGYMKIGSRARRLTPIECERLQGLPDNWTEYGTFDAGVLEIPETQRYQLIGNAVSTVIVTEIGKSLLANSSNLGSKPLKKNNHSLIPNAMITINNYYEEIKKVTLSELPPELRRGHTYVNKQTNNGKSWTKYETLLTVQESIDTYLEQLNNFIGIGLKYARRTVRKPVTKRVTITKRKHPVTKKKVVAKKKPVVKKKPKPRKKIRKPIVRYYKSPVGLSIERIGEELRIIKRFVLLDGRIKTLAQIRAFINALQRAVTEKRIRKTSAYANEIREIQTSLINLHTQMKTRQQMKVTINPERKAHFLTLTGQQHLMPSVRFIKNYISLQGKRIETPKVRTLLNRLEKAVSFRKITARDTYWNQLQNMKTTLLTFIKKNLVSGYLVIPTLELNGLSGIVSGLGSLDGFSEIDRYDTIPKDTIMNSLDFARMKFKTLGFKGKWLDFIGDPSPGFSALVFGQPKFGKSILCLDFAIYLARNHGRVLYVAREEGFGGTFLEKLTAASAANPNLDVSNHSSFIPPDLGAYDFVFIDSITRFKVSSDELEALQNKFPKTSFIYISQVTKAGSARGTNELLHNVDVVIEVPEIGYATQYGRFNQGGTMKIFN